MLFLLFFLLLKPFQLVAYEQEKEKKEAEREREAKRKWGYIFFLTYSKINIFNQKKLLRIRLNIKCLVLLLAL